MIKSRKIIRVLSYILIICELALCLFGGPFSLSVNAKGKDKDTEDVAEETATEEEINSDTDFVEGRYIREDGNVYMKVYYVDKKGATVSLYDTDIDIVWWTDYEPVESQRVFEERFDLGKAKKSDQIKDFKKNILSYSAGKKEGEIKVYISEDNKKIHIEDERKNKNVIVENGNEEERDFSGDYEWQPFVSGHTSLFKIPKLWIERIEEKWIEPGDPIPVKVLERYFKLNYEEVPVIEKTTWVVKDPDKYEHKKVKWKEQKMSVSLEEIAKYMYAHFNGKAVITKAEILDEKEFRDYHLNKRLPSSDGQYCANKADEDAVIKTRKAMLKSMVDSEVYNCELNFFQDYEAREHYTGLYVENGTQVSSEVSLTNGDLKMFYGFSDIDWSDDNANTQYGYVVDESSGIIRICAVANTYITNTGGIAYKVCYDISLYFNDDGSVEAVGTIDCYGLGSEHIEYKVFGNCDEFVMNKEINCNWVFTETSGEYDIVTVIPGEEHTYEEVHEYTKLVPYWEEVNYERIIYLPGIPKEHTNIWEIYHYYWIWIREHHIHIGNWPTKGKAPKILLEDGTIIDFGDEGNIDNNSDDGNDDSYYDDGNTDSGNHASNDDGNSDSGNHASNDDGNSDSGNHASNDDGNPDSGNHASNNGNLDNGNDNSEGGNGIPSEFSIKERIPDYNPQISSVNIYKIAATSDLWNQNASNLIDEDLSTCWSEGVKGLGIGEEILILFDGKQNLTGMGIANGCFASSKAYKENGRVLRLKLTFEDGKTEYFDLSEEDTDVEKYSMSDYYIFDESHKSGYIRLTVEDACAGSKYEDICISELYFD